MLDALCAPRSTYDCFESVFWKTIKRRQQGGNLYIVAFVAYGYKSAWDFSSATRTIDVSPFAIPPENTWGIEDWGRKQRLLFTLLQKISEKWKMKLMLHTYRNTCITQQLIILDLSRFLWIILGSFLPATEIWWYVDIWKDFLVHKVIWVGLWGQ